ncbi:MAG: sigma-70 family RNA polymerase sigma factor [Myxococcota bacterium]
MAPNLPQQLATLLDATDPAARDGAWSGFLDQYSGLLIHTCRRFGGGYDAAMDRYAYVLEGLKQEEFSRLRRFNANGRGKFSTWLVVVSRRLCHDYHRSRYGRDEENVESGSESQTRDVRRRLADLIAEEIRPGTIPDSGAGPEQELRTADLRQALETALATLGPEDRLLLKLRFEDDLPVRRIAPMIGFSTVFPVYRRLRSVLGALRTRLEESGFRQASP